MPKGTYTYQLNSVDRTPVDELEVVISVQVQPPQNRSASRSVPSSGNHSTRAMPVVGPACFDICPQCGAARAEVHQRGGPHRAVMAVMEAVSLRIETEGRVVPLSKLRKDLGGNPSTIVTALKHLTAGGYVIETFGPPNNGGAPKRYEHVRPYRWSAPRALRRR